MASSKVLLLLGLAFVAVILISSEAVSARELAETTTTGATVETDHYGGHGGYGHGGGKGHGYGGYGHGKGHGGHGHGGHHGKPGHGAAEETEAAGEN